VGPAPNARHRMERVLWSAILAVFLVYCFQFDPGVTSASATNDKTSIQMTITDMYGARSLFVNDPLRLTVNTYVGSGRARTGQVYLTTNDPQERLLCGLAIGRREGNFCNIDFPNTGTWTIKAQYETRDVFPPHYIYTKELIVRIRSVSSTTTQPQDLEQATITTISFESYNQVIVTTYYPTEIASVQDASGPYSPEAGVVTFTDATGRMICTAQVQGAFPSECTGSARSSPPPNPITAHYSGTNIGFDDGLGSWYAPSSTTAYVSSEQCSQC